MMLSSLIVLRVLGGLKLYIDPQFHFTYYGWMGETFGKLYLFTFIIAAVAALLL
jgi:hypothetical protein